MSRFAERTSAGTTGANAPSFSPGFSNALDALKTALDTSSGVCICDKEKALVRRMGGTPPGTSDGAANSGASGAAKAVGSGAKGSATELVSTGNWWCASATGWDGVTGTVSATFSAAVLEGAATSTTEASACGGAVCAVVCGLVGASVSTTSAGDATDFFFRRPRRRTPAIPPCPEGPPP